jgi:hypothetical protein
MKSLITSITGFRIMFGDINDEVGDVDMHGMILLKRILEISEVED